MSNDEAVAISSKPLLSPGCGQSSTTTLSNDEAVAISSKPLLSPGCGQSSTTTLSNDANFVSLGETSEESESSLMSDLSSLSGASDGPQNQRKRHGKRRALRLMQCAQAKVVLERPPNPNYDPVETHLIQLQEHYQALRSIPLLNLVSKHKERKVYKKKEEELRAEIKFMSDNIPIYPNIDILLGFRPTCVKVEGRLERSQVRKELRRFVERILAMYGCVVSEEQRVLATWILMNTLNTFLESFVKHMRKVKNSVDFSNSDDLLDPLETTLQHIRYGGIGGLYKFYNRNVVQEYASLKTECSRLHTSATEMANLIIVKKHSPQVAGLRI